MLKEKNDFFTAIIESSNDAIIGKDLNGLVTSWNKAAEHLFGFKASEIIGHSINYIVPTEKQSEIDKILKAIKKNKKIEHYETIRVKRDGAEVKVSLSVSPIIDKQGNVVGAATIARQIPFVTQTQKKFELAVEAAPNGMLMIDALGKVQLVNAQIERMFGYTREELVGKSIEILVPKRFHGLHPKHRKHFLNDPQARLMGAGRELYALRKDGTEFPVEIGLNPLASDEGIVVFASVVDITERKRLAQRFELAVKASPTGMLMINRTGDIVLLNAQITKMFGYEENELMGKKIEMLVPKRFRTKHPGHRLDFFANPKARLMGAGRDLFGQRKDGTEFAVEIGLNPFVTDEGTFVLATVVDITERKKEEERFRLAIEASPTGVLMINQTGEIELVNVQTLKMFKYKKENLIGQKVEFLVPERFRSNHPQYRTAYFRSPEARAMGVGRDLYGLRSDGTEFPVEIGLNPLITATGIYTLASVIDITERKASEDKIKKSNAELERFAYVVSHDLKAPLRGIATIADWLFDGYSDKLDEEGNEYLRLLVSRVKRMQALIDGVLQYSRIGRLKKDPEKINLKQMLEEIIKDLFPPSHISFTIQKNLPNFYGEKTHLSQVFQNLIGNSIKFIDKPIGKIEIGFIEHSKEWQFFVKDNGIGISEKYKNKIFELFQTLASKETDESTGIGLTLSKKIVELYDGKIWFTSKVGKETTFYFTVAKDKIKRR